MNKELEMIKKVNRGMRHRIPVLVHTLNGQQPFLPASSSSSS